MALSWYARQIHDLRQEKLGHAEILRLDLAAHTIDRSIGIVVRDLRRLTDSQPLADYLRDDSETNRLRLQRALINVALHAGIYDQLRFIDRDGHERVRVNYNGGAPAAVADDRLQDKSGRYYVSEALATPAGQVYFSPLDLNVEGDAIEQPEKPALRVSTPLFDTLSGELLGVLVLNYLAAELIARYQEIMAGGWGEPMLLNAQGYWLYSIDPRDQWGFMRGDDNTFARRYPQAWQALTGHESGKLRTAEGLFLFTTLRPQAAGAAGGIDWKAVSRVAPEKLTFSFWQVAREHREASLLLALTTAAVTLLLAWLRTGNIHNSRRLRDNQRSLCEAQQLAHVGNWEMQVPSGELRWSDEIYRIFGFQPRQFEPSYRAFLDSVHPEDRSVVENAVQAALYHKAPYDLDHRILLPDGSVRHVHERAAVQYDGDRPVRMLGTVQDISQHKQAEADLRKRKQRFRDLFEQAPDGIFIADLSGRYIDVNTAGCRMLGYTREEILGKSIIDLLPPEDGERLEQHRQALLAGASRMSEWSLRCRDGSYLPVEVSAGILPDGRWQGFVRDISERRHAEEKLHQAATVFDNTSEGIIITDADKKIIAVNRAYTDITGFSQEESIGGSPRQHKSGQHDEAFYHNLWQTLLRDGQWQGEIWNRRSNGEMFPAWENICVVRNKHGEVTNYISVMADISPIKAAEDRLTYLAHHDVLTELPNRLAFLSALDKSLERARRHARKVALLFIDLDHFKLINDTLGHAVGDRLLQAVAARLKTSIRGEDLPARLGGDEFTVIMEEIQNSDDAALLAQKLIHAIAQPVQLDGHEVVSTASIGISIFPDDADSAGDLAKAADAAMYRAKSHGRQTYEYYTTELTAQARQRLSIENDLRQALARGELSLYYQPQIETASGRIKGVEALLRWHHPQRGLILPGQFVGVAEESGLIDAIGTWVLHEAVGQARRWQQAGLPPLRIAVNLSGRQIVFDHTVASVRQALEHNGYAPGELPFELEITESVLQSGPRTVATFLQLRKLGMSLAIDDFGTGYSSLSQLQQLPIDTLKIDRSFLRNVPHDADNVAITTAVLSMGRSLGLRVIAEGVENPQQLEFLRQQGCSEVQGFLFSEALPPERIVELLRRDGRFTDRPLPDSVGEGPETV